MNYPDIEQLLPHAAPMLLIDRLLMADEHSARCSVRIGQRQQIFLDAEGNLPAWVGIELMAQTIAAWAGYQGWLRAEPPRMGMLLGSRLYKCAESSFMAGWELEVSVEQLVSDGGLSSFQCLIQGERGLLAEARVSTLQPDEARLQQLLGEMKG